MTYNLTAVHEANNWYEFVHAMNQLSAPSGLLMLFFLTSLYIVLIVVLKKKIDDTREVFFTASVLLSIPAILLWAIDLTTWRVVIYPVILIVVSGIMLKISD